MIPNKRRRHIDIVRQLSGVDGPLDRRSSHASVSNHQWFYPGSTVPRRARANLHTHLKQKIRDRFPQAQQGHRALVLAGPPGAGKSSVADQVLSADRQFFINIDADEFKVLLLREALTDGSYESWIKPPEIHTLEAKGERFYPLELASLVHEESSLLASSLRQELIDEGINIIIDTVLSDVNVAIALGQQLADAEYRVTVIDVEVPFEVSEERIVHRWQLVMEEAEAGTADALGG